MWPWAFALLPLPYLVYRFFPETKRRTPIQLPHLPNVEQAQTPTHKVSRWIAVAIWGLLVIATSRPVWYGEPVTLNPEHRDMMLVVDLSYSMSQEDMHNGSGYIDRLTAVKQVLSQFIDTRQGDRLGLIFFADHAYLQTPLTLDNTAVKEQLNRTVLKLIGTDTAIGDGIGLATKNFIDSNAPQRVMILLSDGKNTAGVLDPIKAANIAKKYEVTIYTIGIGAGEMQQRSFFGSRTVNTSKDLDEKALQDIASITGGHYFRAKDKEELNTIYQRIDELEPISSASVVWRPQSEWFPYPLAIALCFSFFLLITRRDYVY
ncbi:VWA domain-containing protein [Vibrio sp.]|nr:VWA domain-containing protein [Vibrio sp.]